MGRELRILSDARAAALPLRDRLASSSSAFRDALAVTLVSRTLVWLAAILSAVVLKAKLQINAALNDIPALTGSAGSVGRVLLTPLAHWDAVWYLGIVSHDYAPIASYGQVRAAFFPLYPLLVWLGSGLGASPGLQLVASFVISLVAFAGALYLLHRLTALELGPDEALSTIVLIALFPGALFFGIPYPEALFLLVSVGAFYAARTSRWAWAGWLAAAASATRSIGALLVLPLALIYLYGPRTGPLQRSRPPRRFRPRYRLRADVLWLAVAPLGIAVYSAYLGIWHHDALAWTHVQTAWMRHFAGPFGAIVPGASAAWRGLSGLLGGSAHSVYVQHGYLEPTRAAIVDVALFMLLLATAAGTVGVFRRLPVAYGTWLVVALALPLSFPASGQALESLPRFLAVLFPLFMWLSRWSREHHATELMGGCFAVLLGIFAAQYAAWEFVG